MARQGLEYCGCISLFLKTKMDGIKIDKPESKSKPKGKEEFGLWAVSKILWSKTFDSKLV